MLVRWDPFEEMNRLHDHYFSGRGLSKQAFQVAVDIREEDDAFHVDAEVPGLAAEDVKVDIEKNVLTLSGSAKSRRRRPRAPIVVSSVSTAVSPGRSLFRDGRYREHKR